MRRLLAFFVCFVFIAIFFGLQASQVLADPPTGVAGGAVGAPWFLPNPSNYGQDLGIGVAGGSAGSGTGGTGTGGTAGGSAGSTINAAKFSSAQISYISLWLTSQIGGYATPATPGTGHSYHDGGAIGLFATSIDSLIRTKPATSRDYIAYMGTRLQIPGVQPAYAAPPIGGTGYYGLTPVLQLWTAMRNVAYLFFAIAFVVVGVMIILRSKVDQKNIITIQTALPKIIIALILVTFSYAIAGFVIDLLYVLMQLIFTILGAAAGSAKSTVDTMGQGVMSGASIFEFVLRIIGWTGPSTFGNVTDAVQKLVDSLGQGNILGLPIVSNIIGGATNLIFLLILIIAILWAVFQIWLKLLMAYVQIIVSVIFAPLLLMLDALPGQNQFQNWFMTLLANALLFPTTVVLILLATIITTNFGNARPGLAGSTGTTPTGGFVAPLIGPNSPGLIAILIGIGILLSIPKILEELPKLLKVQPLPLGNAWQPAAQFGYQNAPLNPVRSGQQFLEERQAVEKARQQARVQEVVKNVHPSTHGPFGAGVNLEARALNLGRRYTPPAPERLTCPNCGYKGDPVGTNYCTSCGHHYT